MTAALREAAIIRREPAVLTFLLALPAIVLIVMLPAGRQFYGDAPPPAAPVHVVGDSAEADVLRARLSDSPLFTVTDSSTAPPWLPWQEPTIIDLAGPRAGAPAVTATVELALRVDREARTTLRMALVGVGVVAPTVVEQPVALAVVPGIAVMFSFYVAHFFAISYFNEHRWGTWPALRMSLGHDPRRIVTAKAAPYWVIGVLQLSAVLVVGIAALGLPAPLAHLPLLAMSLAVYPLVPLAVSLVLVGVSRSLNQVTQLTHLVTLIGGAFSGALIPVDVLPSWMRAVAVVTPQFWGLNAIRGAMVGGRAGAVVLSLVILAAMAAGLFVIGYRSIDLYDEKRVEG